MLILDLFSFWIVKSLKWGAFSRWSFGPNSAWGSIGALTTGKTHPSLQSLEITSDIQNVAYEKPAAKIFFSYCSGINDYFIVWIFFNNSSSKIEGNVYYKPCIFDGSILLVRRALTGLRCCLVLNFSWYQSENHCSISFVLLVNWFMKIKFEYRKRHKYWNT